VQAKWEEMFGVKDTEKEEILKKPAKKRGTRKKTTGGKKRKPPMNTGAKERKTGAKT
jgi:hypothetical protein